MAEIMPDFPEFNGPEAPPEEPALEPEIVNVPAVGTDLSIQPVALSLIRFEQRVAILTERAKSVTVFDADSNKKAVSEEAQNLKLDRDLEALRKNILKPINDYKNQVMNLFHLLQDPLKDNAALIKKTRGQYDYQLLLERRKKEAEMREEQRRLQAQLEAEARIQREEADRKVREAQAKLKQEQDAATRAALEKEIEEETVAAQAETPQMAPLVMAKADVVRTAEAVSYTKFKWQGRVTEPDLVPRDCCVPSQKIIDEQVRNGVRNIPGVIIEEVAIPVTRL